ncbi:40S ribosomal protein S12 [Blastomyces percursus]|uniref:40S ribosomal protein S12 n=1 Tax=Blastomyces percursus TaxID=1658174 RepID=A0A1J9QCZ8_9EURO|nr:40S ribosomal protein S12 [Blastomyces percursus]
MNDADAVLSLPAVPPTNGDTDRHVEPSLKLAENKVPGQARPPSDKHKSEGENGGGNGSDDAVSIKADSEAETIIQSGREELSPEKKRRYIQHKRDRSLGRAEDERDFGVASLSESGKPRKRLRVESDNVDGRSAKVRDSGERTSRALSPPGETKHTKRKETAYSEKTSATRVLSHSRSDGLEGNINRQSTKRWSSEGVRVEEGEARRHGDRQHVSDSSHNKISEETSNTSHSQHLSKHRSTSPAYRLHHRVISGSHSSIDIKKRRRAPPQLATDSLRQVSEDRESASSSTSGSPLPSARLRKLVSSEQAAISPAKQMQVKKQRDQNGRTRLARACAMQEVEAAKARHAERPEDLNISDNAGNTPLQIAALEGCVDIVKFLIEAGCEIDTRNIDRDTPLIDAVENGHLEVVKLLLDAGANPRLGNAEGDEPYDLVPSDSPNYEEMRKIIAEAKARGQRRRKSADQSVRATSSGRDPSSRGASAASPRGSPPVHGQRSPPPPSLGARRRTVRSEATRNDLLWTKATPENLRDFAAKGDMAGVANILNVGQKADPESLIAAAKGGHDEVLGILLGMGDPDPDPEPILTGNHNKPGYDTPMLAAIGRGNTAVIQLLLDQRGFDPTRLDRRGRTYYELSRERKGDHWEREYELLKRAYDNHLRTLKNRRPDTKSPRRVRDKETDVKKHVRRESSSPAPPSQRKATRTSDSSRQTERFTRETDHVKERRKPEAVGHEKDKRVASGGHRLKPPNRENSNLDQSAGGSDQETRADRKSSKDSVPSHNGDERVKRRRLIAGRPPDRVKRRESLMSSDSLSSREETVKQRTEPANPDGKPSKEGPPRKRSRNSASPEPSQPGGHQQKEESVRDVQNQKKRRRVQSEENGTSSSNSITTLKPLELPAPPSKTQPKQKNNNAPKVDHEKSRGDDNDVGKESSTAQRPNSGTSTIKQEQRKSESHIKDIPMEDVDPEAEEGKAKEARETNEARERELREAREVKEAKQAKEEREAKEAKEARERETREMEYRERETREREAREAELAKEAREAEERRAAVQAERDRQEKELREAQAAKEAREAEEAREAAETAARLAREKAEEEERKKKEMELRRIRQAEEERQKRLEQERLRLARLRKEQEEQEQRRRDALPNRLRAAANFVGSNDPISRSHAWLKKFMPLVTVTTKQIDLYCDSEVKDDRWIPNYLVAPLLATNDLQLSQYPSWERRVVTLTQRNNLWRVTRRILVEEGEFNPLTTSYVDVMRKDAETRPKYFAMEHIFWVKYSDFMDLVPHIPHLHGLEIRTLRMHVDPEPGAETIQSDGEETASNPPVGAADEVEVSADTTAGSSMSVLDALKGVLKIALIHDGLARGLREASKALDRRQAHMCVLNEGCEEDAYKKLVIALCQEHKIPLIKVPDGKMLGEWVGLCVLDREGNPRKVVNCSCVVLRDWGEESQERSVLLNYFQAEQ